MTGMQSMISELVASIKANTNAITAPPPPQPMPPTHSPRAPSASSASPHSSRASRHEPYHPHRQQSIPLQQQPYAPPPHHRSSQQGISPSAEGMQRYPPDSSTSHPQRPPFHPHLAPSAVTPAYPASVPALCLPCPSKPHQDTLFSSIPPSTPPMLHPRPSRITTFSSSSQSFNLSTRLPTACGTPARMLPLRLCRSMHMQGVEADPASLSIRMIGAALHNHGSNVSARPPLQQMQQHRVHRLAPRLAGHLRPRRPVNPIATRVADAGPLRIEPVATAIV